MSENYKIDSSYDPSKIAGISRTPPRLEKGVYRMQIVTAERKSSKEGKPKVTLELIAKHNLATDEEAKGRLRFVDVYINAEDTNFMLAQLIDATGVDAPESQEPEDVDAFCEALKACDSVHVLVGMRKNKEDGEFYPSLKSFLTEEVALEKAAEFAN